MNLEVDTELETPKTLDKEPPHLQPAILNLKPYLNPEEPTFLGCFIMISLYKSLKMVGYSGKPEP